MRRFRGRTVTFGLRTLLVIVTLAGIGLGVHVNRTRAQQRLVREVERCGGWVLYDFQRTPDGGLVFEPASPNELRRVVSDPPGSQWLVGLLGVDFLHDVVDFSATDGLEDDAGRAIDDAWLARHLSGAPRLRGIDLCDTRVTAAGLAHLGSFAELENLNLANTRVEGAGLVHLQRLRRLTMLDLGDTRVTDASLAHVRRLAELENLILTNTRIEGPGLAHLDKLRRLTMLDLAGTDIDDASVPLLVQFQALEWLDLENTGVTEQGAMAIRRALPACRVWLR